METHILLLFIALIVAIEGAPDNRGTEFIVTFGQNSASSKQDELFITTSKTTQVSVTVNTPKYTSTGAFTNSFTITAGVVKQLFLSYALRNSGTALTTKGIYVKASDEVVVYGLNREIYSTEAFCALPLDVLGKEYYAFTFYPAPSYYWLQLQLVGTQDGTEVSIQLSRHSACSVSYGGRNYSPGQTLSLTLNRFSTFQMQTKGDISGTYVTSNKPIGMFTGTQRTSIGRGSSSDHIVEMALPVDNWGKKFVLVPIPDRTTGDYWRFVASEANTVISVKGDRLGASFSDSISLSRAGDTALKLYNSKQYCYVTSNKPIMIAQFSLSQQTEEADPSMIMIPPVEQYAADYTFSTPKYSYGSYHNYFMFVVDKNLKSGLRLDGGVFPSNTVYNNVPNTDFVAGYIKVSDGSHTVRHTSPISIFGGFLFGRAKYEAYGFPTGLRLAPINTVCVPTTTVVGDGIDNDCDGKIDEEMCTTENKRKDDDSDGRIDEDCATPPPIDGGWGAWSSYSTCSVSCKPASGSSSGTYTRSKPCNNPTPKYDGKQCPGSQASQTTSCTPSIYCPINGGLSGWSSWGSCTRSCGSGTKTRTKSCNNPTPQHGGAACSGSTSNSVSCNTHNCPVNGGYTSWSSWTSCTRSCGGGSQSRSRSCTSPSPAYGGASCSGSSSATQSCNTHSCAINGGWASWGSWAGCTLTCGGGSKTRGRSCTNPAPQYGGANCPSSSSSSTSCNTHNCPIDGGYTSWSSWTSCSLSCGGGSRSRARSCSNPSPAYGGSSCSGASSATQACNTHNCPIDGAWASWNAWASCTLTCGGGSKTRGRTCSSPAPQYGGANCPSSSSSTTSCNTHNCPIDGAWTSWASWNSCTVTCGGGSKTRGRTCTSPAPQYGGANCPSSSSSTTSCNTHHCPIDGAWTSWNAWAACTLTCGGGTKTRGRTCTNPTPQYGGANCPSSSSHTLACNTHNCPIDGGLTSWSSWTACTVTCGGGTSNRGRSCTNPTPQYGGASCTGTTSDQRTCNTQVCIIDGAWGSWASWGTCTRTCNNGTQSRSRVCDDPAPANGGLSCPGTSSAFQSCNTATCPTPMPGQYFQQCPTGWFTCQSGSISCIQDVFKCDCTEDCDDGSDESSTYATCAATNALLCAQGGADGFRQKDVMLLVCLMMSLGLLLNHLRR